MKAEGTLGSDGTDDLRLGITGTPGGAGKSNWIFSSKVMLFVSFGNNRFNLEALVGRAGSGGN